MVVATRLIMVPLDTSPVAPAEELTEVATIIRGEAPGTWTFSNFPLIQICVFDFQLWSLS